MIPVFQGVVSKPLQLAKDAPDGEAGAIAGSALGSLAALRRGQ